MPEKIRMQFFVTTVGGNTLSNQSRDVYIPGGAGGENTGLEEIRIVI